MLLYVIILFYDTDKRLKRAFFKAIPERKWKKRYITMINDDFDN